MRLLLRRLKASSRSPLSIREEPEVLLADHERILVGLPPHTQSPADFARVFPPQSV
jgi:hypothetical protein